MQSKDKSPRLTQFSPGAGCGCKISPAVLNNILQTSFMGKQDPRLIVGNDSRDDAAVYDLGNGQAVISTTDFFMPITDDAFDFGRIASANAISDIYAMGGTPIMAISILGWPLEKLGEDIARQVLEGARDICGQAGINLAGGHSIDSMEPIFGLAVTGTVPLEKLKRNDTATAGCLLYLTKPLGIGILTTAEKKGLIQDGHKTLARDWMVRLNDIGIQLAEFEEVKAITDVTGFGLLGHLAEMCDGSGLQADLSFKDIPIIHEAMAYIAQGAIPGGTHRNWKSYGHKMTGVTDELKMILCDPQTSGGLLIAVSPEGRDKVEALLRNSGIYARSIGMLKEEDLSCRRVLVT